MKKDKIIALVATIIGGAIAIRHWSDAKPAKGEMLSDGGVTYKGLGLTMATIGGLYLIFKKD